jgi:hypothetical protein
MLLQQHIPAFFCLLCPVTVGKAGARAPSAHCGSCPMGYEQKKNSKHPANPSKCPKYWHFAVHNHLVGLHNFVSQRAARDFVPGGNRQVRFSLCEKGAKFLGSGGLKVSDYGHRAQCNNWLDHHHHRLRLGPRQRKITVPIETHGPVDQCPLWVKSRHMQYTNPCPLYPIATAKADFRTRSCLLYPRKRTSASFDDQAAPSIRCFCFVSQMRVCRLAP